jgi:5'-3' exonuclease
MGKMDQICFNWFYPEGLPPLWGDIVTHMHELKKPIIFPGEILVRREDIQPVEQLCLVLPLESWGLLPFGSCQRQLVERAPWLFPSSFGFGSVGKRYFWECEAEIPVPSIVEVKRILE